MTIKSDREFLDEIHRKIDERNAKLKIEKRKAVTIKRAFLSVMSLFLITIITAVSWHFISTDKHYLAVKPDKSVHSRTIQSLTAKISRTDLIMQSDLIVRGKISRIIGSRWENPNNILGKNVINTINTYYVVEISETYKGVPFDKRQLILSTPGGIIGQTEIVFEAFPELAVNDQVILFLAVKSVKDPLNFYPYKDSYEVLGSRYGVYFYDEKTGEYISNIASDEAPINASTFAGEVKDVLN
jgi:hypothetical protein